MGSVKPKAAAGSRSTIEGRLKRIAKAGGVSPKAPWQATYPDNWAEISTAMRKRANYTCQDCKKRFPPPFHSGLHVHHIISVGKPGSSSKPRNLRVLCGVCHANLHPHMKR